MLTTDTIIQRGHRLFSDRLSLLSLWQEIAEIFYPQRADFTNVRTLGNELTEGLATSNPALIRRDLANTLGGMLRPTNRQWFHMRTHNWDGVSATGRAWLERATERQRRAMYYIDARFSRAAKEADNDFATFGQAVMQVKTTRTRDNMLYKCHHLRDCAWEENGDGMINVFYRKEHIFAYDLVDTFPKTAHEQVKRKAREDPFYKVQVWHGVLPAALYDSQLAENTQKAPYVMVYIDVDNHQVLEELYVNEHEYVIPRWQTVSGSQYAYSPATIVALPDGRTLDAMTATLLEAGEKAVSPPLLGVQGALRSDINVMAAGVTWVDKEYDERLGEVLRPLTQDTRALPFGRDMAEEIKSTMREAFFLDKINLPPYDGRDMTAYEVSQRVQEYIRQTLPLFEPMEPEYNGPICEKTFSRMMTAGAFGSVYEMPEELQGKAVIFGFESPLHDAVEKERGQRYLEASSMVANAAGLDPNAVHVLNSGKALRDALLATGIPASWLRTEQEVVQLAEQMAENAQIQQALQQMQAGADIAKTIGETPAPSGTADTGAVL